MEPAIAQLVLNAGSSTLKYGWFDHGQDLGHGTVDVKSAKEYGSALEKILAQPAGPITAIGHRVVHGGATLRSPVRITDDVKATIRELCDVAPLHNPPALALIEEAQKAQPAVPHVAVFDTAFYAHLPDYRYIYPLPYEWYEKWGIRRFGFHGISHSYISTHAADVMKRPVSELRLISCHLGNGCSATAINGGVAVATSMGFTPVEGLMMGSRPGSVDPGLLLYVLRQKKMAAESLDDNLNHQSGLKGVSGVSGDYRDVLKAASAGNDRARLAIDIYVDRIRSTIGSLSATLGRVDAVIFTAGVGEHATELREAVCKGLEFMALVLDADANAKNQPNVDLSLSSSKVRVYVIPTREEFQIAQEMTALLGKA